MRCVVVENGKKPKGRKGNGPHYIGIEGAQREPHRRRQWINAAAQRQGEAKFVPLDAAGTAPALTSSPAMSGIGVAEKEALPRRTAPTSRSSRTCRSELAGFELRRLRHGGDVTGEFGNLARPGKEPTGRPERSGAALPLSPGRRRSGGPGNTAGRAFSRSAGLRR